jgi:betaine reductase
LGLAVYHVFDEAIRGEADPALWEEQISMMEMVLDTEALAKAVAGMREQYSKFAL